MELDWSTFLLEIVNVLVLVWLLKRFLFRPVMKVIEDRKAAIAKTVAEANQSQSEAKALQMQYEQRLVDWEREKDKARTRFQEELTAERQRRLAALQVELEKEREQASARASQQIREMARQAESTAIEHGTRFATTLLGRLVGPDLEAKLIDVAMEDFSHLDPDRVEAIKTALPTNAHARVTTAFPLTPAARDRVIQAIQRRLDRTVTWEFVEDAGLLAGLRVSLGAWVLRGNLQDELSTFAEDKTCG